MSRLEPEIARIMVEGQELRFWVPNPKDAIMKWHHEGKLYEPEELILSAKAGTPLAEVAMANGLMVEMQSGIKRQGTPNVPQAVAAQVFKTPKDGISSAEGKTRDERIIFKVTDIKEPTFEAGGAAAKPLQEQLKSSYGEELLTQYVNQLETDLNTNVNPQALNQAVGRGTGN